MKNTNKLHDKLKYHVTGVIERGEAEAIEAVVDHTPGPWTLRELGSKDVYAIESNLSHRKHSSTEERVARVETLNEANARLIAAAPELLNTLEVIRNWARGFKFKNIEMECDAAIAKARSK